MITTALRLPRVIARHLFAGRGVWLAGALLSLGLGCTGSADGRLVDTTGFITADDGVRLFYRLVGDGPMTIVVPLGFYLEDSFVRLADPGRRLVFYDPRARGRSDAGDRSRVTLDRQVADLEVVRQGLGLDSMILIGWSGLGMEVAVYALRHPDRVIRMVQITPVAARDEPYNTRAWEARTRRMDRAALTALESRYRAGGFVDDPNGFCRDLWRVTGPANFADSMKTSLATDVCGYANEQPDSLNALFGSLLPSFAGYDWRSELSRLTLPRLVVHGAQDAFPVEGSREWAPPGSNARVLVIDRAAHFPFVEQPERLFGAIETFLRGRWPPGAE